MKRAALALCLFLALLAPLMSLLQFESVSVIAEASIPKPSVPEFTVKFVNASYSVTTTNPYTGLEETELINNNTIEITINNQPFDHSDFQIYYNIRVKPHFEGDWIEVYPLRNRTSSYNEDGTFSYSQYINDDAPQSESSFTSITFPVVPTELYLASGYDIQKYYSGDGTQEGDYFAFLSAIPDRGQLDFQVEASVGHYAQVYVNDHPLAPYPIGHNEQAVAFDITSGWSSTQTITIGESASATTPTPLPSQSTSTPNESASPSQNLTATSSLDTQLGVLFGLSWEQTALAVLCVLAVILVIADLIVYFRKRRKRCLCKKQS